MTFANDVIYLSCKPMSWQLYSFIYLFR